MSLRPSPSGAPLRFVQASAFPVCSFLACSLLALFALVLPASAQSPTRAPWLLSAADADQDGTTDGVEWELFQRSLPPGSAPSSYDRAAALGRCMLPFLDPEPDGKLNGPELERLFKILDANENGDLTAWEAAAGKDLPSRQRFLASIVSVAADEDLDGRVSSAEWSAWRGTHDDPLDQVQLGRMLTLGMRGTTEDRDAMSASVILLGYDAALDVDQDGQLTASDFQAHFRAADTNGDGAVTKSERDARPQRDRSGFRVTGEVNAEARMPWQRSLADARLLSQRTGKPMLLCVNMDGEAASDSLSTRRYRTPEFIELAQGFVPLIASPDRRNPFDYDDRGKRLEDPKFGHVTNSEAIDIEPSLYEAYFGGRRVAPRHVGVAPDGTILFDLILLQDLSIIDRALLQHGKPEGSTRAGSTDEEALLDSPDAVDRSLLEATFLNGDLETRVRLAGRALSDQREVQHPELIRIALRDDVPEVRALAAATLLRHPQGMPRELFLAARDELGDKTPELIAALALRTEEVPEADRGPWLRLRSVLEATQGEGNLDVGAWKLALRLHGLPLQTNRDFEATVALVEEAMGRLRAAPNDPTRLCQAAEAQLAFGDFLLARGDNPTFAFTDARSFAERAQALEGSPARAQALQACAMYLLGEDATEAARSALMSLAPQVPSRLDLRLVDVFLRTQRNQIYTAMQAGQALDLYTDSQTDQVLDANRLREVFAAGEILMAASGISESLLTPHLDMLGSLELYAEQTQGVLAALERSPTSPTLHNYLRFVELRDRGARSLQSRYEVLVADAADEQAADVLWYAGMANYQGAEHLIRREQRAEAEQAYAQALKHFQASVDRNPDYLASSAPYLALAGSGWARLEAETSRLESGVEKLLQAIAIHPGSATSSDGLGNTPMGTARLLEAALKGAQREDLVEQLRDQLGQHGVEGYP